MEAYYMIVLLFMVFLQDNITGLLLNLTTFFCVTLSSMILSMFILSGVDFYISTYLEETILFIITILLYKIHKSIMLSLVFFISILINILLATAIDNDFTQLLYNNYEEINMILFETLVFICFKQTKLYKYLKTTPKRVVNTIKR